MADSNSARRRRRTVGIPQGEVDFMVLEYSCRDSSAMAAIGKSCQESKWKIAVGGGSAHIDVKLTIDTNLLGKSEVSLACNGRKVFPPPDSKDTTIKLVEDLHWQCPFRGTIGGIGEKNRFELRPEHAAWDTWYPATLLEQRADGLFKVAALMPDGPGTKEVAYPAVRQEYLRYADDFKKPVTTPMRSLVLQVPSQDPLAATLSVDSTTLMTHFFARPTPPPEKSKDAAVVAKPAYPRLFFSVSKDRSIVNCEVGHTVLSHFLSGQPRQIRQDAGKAKHIWTVQLGPFAVHTIEVERRYKFSKVVTLVVDGRLLAESTAEDLESPEGVWECAFRYVGEKFLDWEVFETTPAGSTTSTKSVVSDKRSFKYECLVSLPMPEDKFGLGVDLAQAKLTIDGKDFAVLPENRSDPPEDKLLLAPEALVSSYGLTVPKKVASSSTGLEALMAVLGTRCSPGSSVFCCGGSQGTEVTAETGMCPTRMEASGPEAVDIDVLFTPNRVEGDNVIKQEPAGKEVPPDEVEQVGTPDFSENEQPNPFDEGLKLPPVPENAKPEIEPQDQKSAATTTTPPEAEGGAHVAEGGKKKCCVVQ